MTLHTNLAHHLEDNQPPAGSRVVHLARGKLIVLGLDPSGAREPLYRLAMWDTAGRRTQLGGFTLSSSEMILALMGLEQLARQVDREGLPGERR